MKTKTLILKTADVTGFADRYVRRVIEVALELIADELAENDAVKLKGLGRLSTRRMPSAVFVDTLQGTTQEIKGGRLVHFSADVKLLKEINMRELASADVKFLQEINMREVA